MHSTPAPSLALLQRQADIRDNQEKWLLKRLELETLAKYDVEVQAAVRAMCTQDVFFWFNHFAWTYDPRQTPDKQVVPFILWDFQVELIQWLLENIEATLGTIERRNLAIEKSRDMGASWVVALFAFWAWNFRNYSILIGSRKMDGVDILGDMSTLFEKIRFNIKRQPNYLLPPNWSFDKHSKLATLINPLGGEITGEASTGDFGRGGRKTLIIFDEFAAFERDEPAWQSAAQSTNVRLAISTPLGPHNKFARIVQGKDKEVVQIKRLHWSIHPVKSAGLTHTASGALTSPWYESQKATMSEEDIAKELDINYATSIKGQVFPDYTEKHRIRGYVPDNSGTIVRCFDPGLTFFILWLHIDSYNRVVAFREMCIEQARIRDVGEEVVRLSTELEQQYKLGKWADYGDPAGASRSGAGSENPEYTTLAYEYDIDVDYTFMSEMPPRMRVKNRISAIRRKLGEFCVQRGTPSLLVDVDACPLLNEALSEGYRWKVDRITREVTEQVDEKHPFEDAVDCLGYGLLGHLGLGLKRTGKETFGVANSGMKWGGQLNRRRR